MSKFCQNIMRQKAKDFFFVPRLIYFEEKAEAKADFKAELEFNGTFKSGPNCPLKGQLVSNKSPKDYINVQLNNFR